MVVGNINEPQTQANSSTAITDGASFEFDPEAEFDDKLTSLIGDWDDSDLNLFAADHDTEAEDDEEEDFFAENKEEEQLEEHMKDNFLECVQKARDEDMTMQDFEQSQFDVYGILQPVEETPEMVSKALHDLDVEISRLKGERGSRSENYILAESQNEQFVSDRSFRLKFLRCEKFDVQAAAIKVLAFFDSKLDLWGPEKLTKKITLSDFDTDGIETMKNGHIQLLPVRDHAGRSIIFNNLNRLKFKDPMNQLRAIYYLATTASEDEETQKNGLTFIQYKVGEQKGVRPTRQLLWKGAKLERACPLRLVSFHLCFGTQSLPFVQLLKYGLEYQTSNRVRVHEGTQSECLHKLMTFGIQRYAIPLASNGDITKGYHLDWLAKRRISEAPREDVLSSERVQEVSSCELELLAADSSSSIISPNGGPTVVGVLLPSQHDILLGRGKRAQYHPGNIRLNLILEDHLEEYNLANRKKKVEIALSVVASIKQRGGRFLQKGEGSYWNEVTEEVAKKKIMHDFRTIRQRLSSGESSTTAKTARKEKRGADSEVDSLPPEGKRQGLIHG